MSTEEIRYAASRRIDVAGAGSWSFALVYGVALFFIAHPLLHAWQGNSCADEWAWVPWAKASVGILWLSFFAWTSPDRRGLAAAAGAKLGALPYFLVWGPWVSAKVLSGDDLSHAHCVPDLLGLALWGPLMLFVSLLGLGGCASMPAFGRCCVRFLLQHNSASSHRPHRCSASDDDSDDSACDSGAASSHRAHRFSASGDDSDNSVCDSSPSSV
mmetsp:Transcript_98757/g.283769  ORF Transcript_98757/g.283769 Transcript_98757/m.283769 type:complete len:214 (+) Transcript_98757:1-642(+)